MPKPHPLTSLRHESRPGRWAGPVLVALISLTVFGYDLSSEPHFVDESAYLSQSFYADLMLGAKWDDPSWLSYAGYDLPPLPKYVIGWSLRAHGYRRPGPLAMRAWYRNIEVQFSTNDEFTAARIPSVVLGTLGCLAIYALGCIAGGRRVGLLAAGLLMSNPLYAMHARRAMSDVYAEAFLLSALAVGLWSIKRLLSNRGWYRPFAGLAFGSGTLVGLATLSKLNGSLAGMILGAWSLAALFVPKTSAPIKPAILAATFLSGVVAFATFAALNPFLYSHPKIVDRETEPLARSGFWSRVKVISDHRIGVSDQAMRSFPHNALPNLVEKLKAVSLQGFGRFGPFGPRTRTDSTIRYDRKQDWGAAIWLPTVILGAIGAGVRGLRQLRLGEPPGAWAILIQSTVALVVVTAFIPLAWDRYFLSIQPGSALLGAFTLVEGFDLTRALCRGSGKSEGLI